MSRAFQMAQMASDVTGFAFLLTGPGDAGRIPGPTSATPPGRSGIHFGHRSEAVFGAVPERA
jgi:hypothetical protein